MTVKFKSIIKQNFKLVVLASKQLEDSSLPEERSLLEETAQTLKSDKHLLKGVMVPLGP